MTLVDDRILEFLSENEAGSPTEITEGGRLNYTRQYVSQRCRELADRGLLRRIAASTYVITDEGEAYVDGEFDVHNWVYIDEQGRPTNAADEDSADQGAWEPDAS
jgi:predicted transcriptional regulator